MQAQSAFERLLSVSGPRVWQPQLGDAAHEARIGMFISVLVRGPGAPAVKSYLVPSSDELQDSNIGFFGDGVPKCMDVGGMRGHMHIVDLYAWCT